jgi:hypothetical protein
MTKKPDQNPEYNFYVSSYQLKQDAELADVEGGLIG